MALLGNQGMKPESCDPLIGIEAGDLEFDKLPHYFSSGKPRYIVMVYVVDSVNLLYSVNSVACDLVTSDNLLTLR